MKTFILFLVFFSFVVYCRPTSTDDDTVLVQKHVRSEASKTFRNASGALPYPYLVPSGPYNEAWDWDSMFMAVALENYGARPYAMGTFLNFLHFVNLSTGELPGCLTPSGPSKTLYHAKPLIIQAAFITARQNGNFTPFLAYAPQMRALLLYWNNTQRRDAKSGLHTWHDQLETGADNLVFSECPSQFSPECWSESQAYTLSSPDVMVWLAREYAAYAQFMKMWGQAGLEIGGGLYSDISWLKEAEMSLAYVTRLRDVIHERLWLWIDPPLNTRGLYVAFNVSTGVQSVHRTYQAAWPVWAGLYVNDSVKNAALTTLLEPDLWTQYGLRSASQEDPRYSECLHTPFFQTVNVKLARVFFLTNFLLHSPNPTDNDNIINPYSNWRGPVWINVASIMAYTLRAMGETASAGALADTLVHTLAQDIRDTGQWHECYSSANGTGLAAPGFLSWDTLGADLQSNVETGLDPFSILSK